MVIDKRIKSRRWWTIFKRYFQNITVDPEIECFERDIWYGEVDMRIDKKF